MKKTCLIVGAGMSGLTAASALLEKGWTVELLDKGRTPGGRMATRRIGESRFDHGAQFFTVRDPRFQSAVDRWQAEGIVSPWFIETHIRYRAEGGMNALAKFLARALDVHTEAKVQRISAGSGGWTAFTESGAAFHARTILLTAPAPQSAALLERPAGIIEALNAIHYDPCFALLVRLRGTSGVPAPGYVRPTSSPIEWVADNTQKGVSSAPAALTIHATAAFSRQYFDCPQDEVARLLLDAASAWCDSGVLDWQLHRWRYSKPVDAERAPCLVTSDPAPLAVAGDAFGGSRVEGAYLSGLAAANAIDGTA